jgi:uncharacterized membrane protein YdjX (TVP38/TMEM64 family)
MLTIVLAIPIVPFLMAGDRVEGWMASWLDARSSHVAAAAIVAGLLSTDVFLPVPSSLVSTFGGRVLGFWVGTAVSWAGMSVGAVFAFWLARRLGRRMALRLARAEDLQRIDALSERFGPMVLVVSRPVPILAEASILFLGSTRLAWRRFVGPILLSNLGIAAAYSALGDLAPFPVALAAAIALPLLAATIARFGLHDR